MFIKYNHGIVFSNVEFIVEINRVVDFSSLLSKPFSTIRATFRFMKTVQTTDTGFTLDRCNTWISHVAH